MSLIKVPKFSKLNPKNGTLYNFSNFNNDLTKSIANTSSFQRIPSKFVCIKLPSWKNLTSGREMYMASDKISPNQVVTDPNEIFPLLLQNYIENMAAYAIKENVVDYDVTEYAFWKLLSNLGSIKLEAHGNSIVDTHADYLVSYVGDINVVNYVEYGNRTYTETYVHIPSNARLTKIGWKQSKESNVARLPLIDNGRTTILGHEPSTQEVVNALYDFDNAGNSIGYYDLASKASKAVLDFASAVTTSDDDDFEFNAILMYYDSFDVDSAGKRVNQKRKLGNIFLIDKFVQDKSTNDWSIPCVTKYNNKTKNDVTGNAIAYRLCTNFFTQNEQSVIDTIVNEYNTVSMDLYVKALQEMLKTGEIHKQNQVTLNDISNKLATLNFGQDTALDIKNLKVEVANLTNTLNGLIGASGYTVTNFELLDAFTKLSNDFKGANGPNVQNIFNFNQHTQGQNQLIADLYAYIENSKYNIAYSEESLYQVMQMRNKVLGDYSISAIENNGILEITYNSKNLQNTYIADFRLFNNLQSGQLVKVQFASDDSVKPMVIAVNASNGKVEVIDYNVARKTALKGYAYLGSFNLPSLQLYNLHGVKVNTLSTQTPSITQDIYVALRQNAGKYNNGDKIDAGTSIEEVISNMLVDPSLLSYERPQFITKLLTQSQSGYDALHTIESTFVQNDAGEIKLHKIVSNEFTIEHIKWKIDTQEFYFVRSGGASELQTSPLIAQAISIVKDDDRYKVRFANCEIIDANGNILTGDGALEMAALTEYLEFRGIKLKLKFESTQPGVNLFFVGKLDGSFKATATAIHEEGKLKRKFGGEIIPGRIIAGTLTNVVTTTSASTSDSIIFANDVNNVSLAEANASTPLLALVNETSIILPPDKRFIVFVTNKSLEYVKFADNFGAKLSFGPKFIRFAAGGFAQAVVVELPAPVYTNTQIVYKLR